MNKGKKRKKRRRKREKVSANIEKQGSKARPEKCPHSPVLADGERTVNGVCFLRETCRDPDKKKVQRNAEQVFAVLASEMRLGSLGVLVIGRLCAYFTETSTHLSLDRHVLINKFIVVNAVQWLFLDMIF